MLNLRLRLITEDDLDWVRKLRNDNQAYFFTQKNITRKQHQQWYKSLVVDSPDFFVIWWGDNRVGTISVIYNQDKKITTISNVLIEEGYRHRGILKEALEILKKEYGKNMELEVKSDNINAIKTYKRLGFKPFGIRMRT